MKMPFFGKLEPPALTGVEAVQAKLAACNAEIAEAEQELRRVSLGAALGEDQGTAYQALAHLTQLRAKREVLNAALAAAQQAEHQAARAARSQEFAARRRAASQHAARLEREARAVSEIEHDLLAHFEVMTDAAGALVATLPPHMRSDAEPWDDMLSPGELRDAVLVEGYRLNRERRAWLFQRQRGTIAFEDRETGQLPALTDRIAGFTATIKQHFDQSAPFKPKSNPPELAKPVSSAPVSDDVFSPSMSSGAAQREPRDEEVIDLRGRDLGIAKSAASEASIGEEEAVNG